MQKVKFITKLDEKSPRYFNEEHEVENNVDAAETIINMVKNFNNTLREGEVKRTIVKLEVISIKRTLTVIKIKGAQHYPHPEKEVRVICGRYKKKVTNITNEIAFLRQETTCPDCIKELDVRGLL